MIFAELHNKLGRDYSLAHDRAEDLLTSTVFQLMRYLPVREGFVELLNVAHMISGRRWVLADIDSVGVQMWPSLGRAGRPDVLLEFRSRSRLTHVIAIEAKLEAGKSGFHDESDEISENENDGQSEVFNRDQLAKYWQGLSRNPALNGIELGIIYLTSHLTAPHDELSESLKCAPDMRLAWCSWYHVWEVMNQIVTTSSALVASWDSPA